MSTSRTRKQRERITDRLTQRTPESDDPTLIAVDPGDQYVGVAFFKEAEDGWYCMDAVQLGYWEFIDGFESLIFERPGTPPTVVVEKFRLYNDKAHLQTGSEFLTSQMIGIIKYIVRCNNQHVTKHGIAEDTGVMLTCELNGAMCDDPDKKPIEIDLVIQPADIKKPTRGILRHKGIHSVGKAAKKENPGWGDHCIDAELHGWHHILRTLEGTPSEDA